MKTKTVHIKKPSKSLLSFIEKVKQDKEARAEETRKRRDLLFSK